MYKEVFPSRFKAARLENNLTQTELAHILNITQPTIAAYESGKRTPDIEVLGKISTCLFHTTDYFLGLAND